MTGLEEALIIGAIMGGASAATGMVAWLGSRFHGKLDKIGETLSGEGGHTSRLAVIESKLPNGEWKKANETLARVEEAVSEVQEEQTRVREELHAHIVEEETRIVEAVVALKNAEAT